MSDPYEVLNLAPNASAEEIRACYLQLVRENPPDRAPERFAEIRAAYDDLRDPARQLAAQLFRLDGHESLDDLQGAIRLRLRTERLSLTSLLSLADYA